MAKVLGAKRLSHDTDASTSNERQGEMITAWAAALDHTVVAITEDTDISGAVSPFDRPDLGKWLTDARLGQWDILVVAKLDRVSRSLIDFANLLEWCQKHGKVLVSVSEGLDFGTPTGQFVGKILILFAEFERQMMRERRADAARKLYAEGGYNGGGSMPWGYVQARIDGKIELSPDPNLVELISEIAEEVIGGKSVTSVAERYDLDAASLLRRLRSPSLKGVVMLHDEIVRDHDGMPVLREPILSAKTWGKLQARLDANSRGAGIPRDATPWLDVIFCRECGGKLYFQSYRKRVVTSFYHKRGACRVRFRGAEINSQIEPLVMLAFGDSFIPEVVDLPAEDHTAELAQVDEAITDWEARAISGESADSVMRILDGLHAKRKALAALPVQEARKEVSWSTDTFRDRWASLESDHERGDLLRRMGVRLLAFHDRKGRARLILHQGKDAPRRWTVADVLHMTGA